MTRRPRVVWLTDEPAGTGAATMVERRIVAVGASSWHHTRVVMRGRPTAPTMLRAGGLAAEAAIARADLLVTTSELTLMSVAPRLQPRTRVLHVLHEPVAEVTRRARSMRVLPLATLLAVPAAQDLVTVARAVGLPPWRVGIAEDFVDAAHPPGTPQHVVLAVGSGRAGSGIAEVVRGFALAAPSLPGWQLRLAGDALSRVDELLDELALRSRVVPLGLLPDLTEQYARAAVVARLGAIDAWGLPVLEALAAGVPVLAASSVPAARRHVTHGREGLLLDRTDPEQIAAALVELASARAGFAAAAAAALVVDPAAGSRTRDLLDTALRLPVDRTEEMLTHVGDDAKETE